MKCNEPLPAAFNLFRRKVSSHLVARVGLYGGQYRRIAASRAKRQGSAVLLFHSLLKGFLHVLNMLIISEVDNLALLGGLSGYEVG